MKVYLYTGSTDAGFECRQTGTTIKALSSNLIHAYHSHFATPGKPVRTRFTLFDVCGVLPACVPMHHVHLVSVESCVGIGFPGTGVKGDCEPPRGF